MQAIGKLLQVVGLIMLPLGMVMEVTGGLPREQPVAGMLLIMLFGFALFYAGRYLEGYGRPS